MNWLFRFAQQVWDWLDEAHLRWGMREIHPLHADVPRITLRLAEIDARRSA
jgi:hypothetical protein